MARREDTTKETEERRSQRSKWGFRMEISSPQISLAIVPISWSCWKRETAALETFMLDEQREMRREVSMLLRYSMLSEEKSPCRTSSLFDLRISRTLL